MSEKATNAIPPSTPGLNLEALRVTAQPGPSLANDTKDNDSSSDMKRVKMTEKETEFGWYFSPKNQLVRVSSIPANQSARKDEGRTRGGNIFKVPGEIDKENFDAAKDQLVCWIDFAKPNEIAQFNLEGVPKDREIAKFRGWVETCGRALLDYLCPFQAAPVVLLRDLLPTEFTVKLRFSSGPGLRLSQLLQPKRPAKRKGDPAVLGPVYHTGFNLNSLLKAGVDDYLLAAKDRKDFHVMLRNARICDGFVSSKADAYGPLQLQLSSTTFGPDGSKARRLIRPLTISAQDARKSGVLNDPVSKDFEYRPPNIQPRKLTLSTADCSTAAVDGALWFPGDSCCDPCDHKESKYVCQDYHTLAHVPDFYFQNPLVSRGMFVDFTAARKAVEERVWDENEKLLKWESPASDQPFDGKDLITWIFFVQHEHLLFRSRKLIADMKHPEITEQINAIAGKEGKFWWLVTSREAMDDLLNEWESALFRGDLMVNLQQLHLNVRFPQANIEALHRQFRDAQAENKNKSTLETDPVINYHFDVELTLAPIPIAIASKGPIAWTETERVHGLVKKAPQPADEEEEEDEDE